MTVSIVNHVDGTSTFKFEVRADATKVLNTSELVAECLYNRGLLSSEEQVPWDEVTQGAKADMISDYITMFLRGMARGQQVTNALDITRAEVQAELDNVVL